MKRLAILFASASVFCFACLSLTPAEQKEIGDTAAVIAGCQAVGRACAADGGTGCYGEYHACMKEAGL